MANNGARKVWLRFSVLDIATVVVLLIACVLQLQPGSVVRTALSGWWHERALKAAVARSWEEMASAAARLYRDDADPEVIEFVDYQCPSCRHFRVVVDSAVAEGVRIGILQLPLPIHPRAESAALAALCGELTGDFTGVHAKLLTNSEWYESPEVGSLLSLVGTSYSEDYRACVTEAKTDTILRWHVHLASEIGVRQTPFFVARGRILAGPPTLAALRSLSNAR